MRIEIPTKLYTDTALDFAYKLKGINVDDYNCLVAKMQWVRPFSMLYMALVMKNFREKNKTKAFEFEPDFSAKGFSYATNMGFISAISKDLDSKYDHAMAFGNDNYIPIHRIDLSKAYRENRVQKDKILDMGDIIEMESRKLAIVLSRNNEEFKQLMTYIIREMIRNIYDHSQSQTAWACGQYWKNDNKVEIAICDEGIGILKSMKMNRIYRDLVTNDLEAIKLTLNPGVSQAYGKKKTIFSNEWDNSGFGLYMVKEVCKDLNGELTVASGEDFLTINSSGIKRTGHTYFNGTAIRILIDTSKEINCQKLIDYFVCKGEKIANKCKYAFHTASVPSRGLMSKSKSI